MKKSITAPHDRFTRAALSDQRVARAFFESHLPSEILKLVDLDSLTLCKESFVDEKLKLAITDMLFSVMFGKRQSYIYLLVEAQNKPQWWLPLRLLKYILEIMEGHCKITGDKQLPIIYPMVLYNGKVVYNEPMDLFEMFGENQALGTCTK